MLIEYHILFEYESSEILKLTVRIQSYKREDNYSYTIDMYKAPKSTKQSGAPWQG